MSPWKILCLAPTTEAVAIKRAYAKALRQHRPDEDPAGYQRLRECYEWALEWASAEAQRAAPVNATVPEENDEDAHHSEAANPRPDAARPHTAPTAAAPDATDPQAEAPAVSAAASGSAPDPASDAEPSQAKRVQQEADAEPPDFVNPAELVSSLHQHWQQHGDAALLEALPRLLTLLNEVPLSLQGEACWRCAVWVVEQPVPDPVVDALRQFYGWGQDYRIEGLLGPQLAPALIDRLREVPDSIPLNADQQRELAPMLELVQRAERGPRWRARAFAASLPHTFADALPEVYLGIWRRVFSSHAQMLDVRRIFFELGLILCGVLGVLGGAIGWAAWGNYGFALGIGVALPGFALLGSEVFPALSRLLDRLFGAIASQIPGLKPPGLVCHSMAILIALASAWLLLRFDSPWLVPSWIVSSLCACALSWDLRMPWRPLLVPSTLVLAFGLLQFQPEGWSVLIIFSLAQAWVLLAHWLACRNILDFVDDPERPAPTHRNLAIAMLLRLRHFVRRQLFYLASTVSLPPTLYLMSGGRVGTAYACAWLGVTGVLLFVIGLPSWPALLFALCSPALLVRCGAGLRRVASWLAGPPPA